MQSYEQVKAEWKRHKCPSESGACDCLFEFPCQSCGTSLKVQGENLDFVIGIGGLCEMCYFRPGDQRMSKAEASILYPDRPFDEIEAS